MQTLGVETEADSFVLTTPPNGTCRSSCSEPGQADISFDLLKHSDGFSNLTTSIPQTHFSFRGTDNVSSDKSLHRILQTYFPDAVVEITSLDQLNSLDMLSYKYDVSGKDPNLIMQYAQILAEQMIYDVNSTLDNDERLTQSSSPNMAEDEGQQIRLKDLYTTLYQTFPLLQRQRIQDLTQLLGVGPDSTQLKVVQAISHTRQQGSNEAHLCKGLLSSIDAPHVALRRGENAFAVTSTALSFWEELSLSPLSEEKHIHCLTIIPIPIEQAMAMDIVTTKEQARLSPHINHFRMQVQSFINQISYSYQSFKLGTYSILPGPNTCEHAVNSSEFLLHCERLGKSWYPWCTLSLTLAMSGGILTAIKPQGDVLTISDRPMPMIDPRGRVLVVLMIDYSPDRSLSPFLCEGFVKLLTNYRRKEIASGKNHYIDMVLQILPIDLIRQSHGVSIPSVDSCNKLALQIYERCPGLKHDVWAPHMCEPSMKLSGDLPTSLHFRITSNNASPFPNYEVLHVAYTWSSDSPWLTASWSDQLGEIQWNTAYYIGLSDGDIPSEIGKIMTEIVETSVGLRHRRDGLRAFLIAKCGHMSVKELNSWRNSLQPFNGLFSRTSIVVIDPEPQVRFELPSGDTQRSNSIEASQDGARARSTSYSGPSPLRETSSDRAAALAPLMATLGEENKSARLVNIIDEYWGVPLACPLDQREGTDKNASSQSSSYLIKRVGNRGEEGVISMGINVVHTSASSPELMASLLVMYRRLAVLAGHRGIIDPVKQILPIHTAASLKAHSALTRLMS